MNSISALIIKEPQLIFGGGFPANDPKLGISLYGPYSTTRNTIRIGIIGDKQTISQVMTLLASCRSRIEAPVQHPLWTQDFPGMSSQSPFKCELVLDERWHQTITTAEVEKLEQMSLVQERISYSVDLFVKYLTNLKEREESPDVVVCAPPKKMMDKCLFPKDLRTGRRISGRYGSYIAPSFTQSSLIDFMPGVKESMMQELIRISAENFHHLLKAKSMSLSIPTQFILPYTLDVYTTEGKKRLQDPATFAWNLCIALLYKSGGRPWRPAYVPSGTCFVGISFYREKQVFGGGVGTSVAQVFTPEGEGLVLRGERFEWTRSRSPHLTSDAAKRLLEKALELYERQTKQKASRVVLHKSSLFWNEELEGFKSALEGIPMHDFVSLQVGARQIRFFRTGYHAVMRGTMISLPDKSWLLYTKGYVPQMKVYPGPHIPNPLEILQHEGDSTPEKISNEIMALTKLNWNNADFGSLMPITLKFSTQVGKILREMPPGVTPENRYLYYM